MRKHDDGEVLYLDPVTHARLTRLAEITHQSLAELAAHLLHDLLLDDAMAHNETRH